MKKIISLVLVAALLLSLFTVTAFAAEPTSGPAQKPYMYGGARIGIFDSTTQNKYYTLNYDYDQQKVVINNSAVEGMTYDLSTNTLTINNLDRPNDELFIWYMGNDFKMNVVGNCSVGIINVYDYFNFHDTSLNIVGTGTLSVNEQKLNDRAIFMQSGSEGSLMSLDIADTVTVHLYNDAVDDEEQPLPLVYLSGTVITPEDGGAITVGGKAAPEAKSEQIVEPRADTVNAIVVNRDVEHTRGQRVKSKTDPNGVYALAVMDGVIYVVSRYIYSNDLGMWIVDYSFRDAGYIGKAYTKAEFEEAYDYVYGMAPTPIEYADTWAYENRGNEAVKLTKHGEPEAVYAGTVDGDEDLYDPEGYTVYRVIWDDEEEIYKEDTSFESRYYTIAQLKEDGYQIETEQVTEQMELTVWTSDDFDDPSGFEMTRNAIRRKSAPKDLFVEVGTYSGGGESGITMYRVHFDPVAEEFYILYNSYSPQEFLSVSYEDLENETDFFYDVQTIDKPVNLRFLDQYYGTGYYMRSGIKVSKTGDPDTVYAYNQLDHYVSPGVYEPYYELIRLVYNEKVGCYFDDPEFEAYEFTEMYQIEAQGYLVEKSEQILDYVTQGEVDRGEFDIYTNQNGKRYYVDYHDNVYRFAESDLITLPGDNTAYYWGNKVDSLSRDDLNDTIHDVIKDNYNYWISGPEYHHVAGETPATGYTVSGTATSYKTNDGVNDVTLKLTGSDNNYTDTVTVTASYSGVKADTAYSFENVPAGEYTLSVEKGNHVTREYTVSVSADTVQNVKICPIGDTDSNGRVNSADAKRTSQHANGQIDLKELDPYQFACADTAAPKNRINSADAKAISQHANAQKSLWTVTAE